MLFKPIKPGPIEIQNRFIHSATYEGIARITGAVTDEILKRYRNLANRQFRCEALDGRLMPKLLIEKGRVLQGP